MPTITGIHHLSLTVRDAAKSEEFYTRAFGFVRVLELPDVNGNGAKRVLAHAESQTILGFSVHQANDGSAFSEFRTGLDHLALGVASRAEFEEWITKLDELGVEHSEERSTAVGNYVSLRDPDNVQIELWLNPA
jgi:catechol 2,3-dioxygenase-like lactoylglutathione lyase family enzyme